MTRRRQERRGDPAAEGTFRLLPQSNKGMGDRDERLARCVRRDDGLILRGDQKHLPDASNVLRVLESHRVITRLGRGIYAETGKYQALHTWERYDLQARALGETSRRILAGYSAAAVWGLWRYSHTPTRHAFYRPGGGAQKCTDRTLRQVFYVLRPGDVTGEHLKATSIERTVVDLTRMNGFGAGFVAACSALRLELTTSDQLRAYDTTGKEGLAHWPLLVEKATGVVESALEAVFLAQSVFHGDFELIPQVPVRGRNGKRYVLDFGVAGTDEFVELDGRGKYGASISEQEFSLRKEKERADNLPVQPERFGWAEVMDHRAYRRMLHKLGLVHRWDLPPIHRE